MNRRRGVVAVSVCRALAMVCAVSVVMPTPMGATRRRRASHSRPRRRAARPAAIRVSRAAAAVRTASELDAGGVTETHVHLKRGDTFESVLDAHGVDPADARPWLAVANAVFDLRRLHPRQGLTLRFARATHALQTVRYQIDDHALLVLERTPRGIEARRAALPYFTEVKGAAGRIERGLREDATEAGVPPTVVSEVAEIFGWDLDVASDLRAGDEFRVLYQNIWQAGELRPSTGKVLGAEVVADGRPHTAVFYEDPDGRGGYYRPSGDPVSRALLRYPVEFTEISSEFSLLRLHPILHRTRPHLGVDFAAPSGTPVRAVANGVISFEGWVKQLGRCVRIDHTGALASTYGHLARIAAGVRTGAPVERGQVIGYVGATGLATGPHLHFALHRDGEYVDPLTVMAAPGPRIADPERRHFERVQAAVTRQLALLPETMRPLTVSLSDADLRGD